jgi:membrane associated rhomboid family serine protease
MENREKRKFLRAFILPFFFVSLLWIVKGIEVYFDWNFTSWGIKPRDFTGLRGVLFSPFIHGDLNHLFNNSVPLLILGWALFYFYKKIALRVVFWSYLLAGLYTWISARTSYHIGASGLVYSLFGFIFISGFIRKNISLISISFLSAFLYGSLIWGILPWDKSVSWEGHFWGLFVGLVLAVYYRKVGGPPRKKYSWEIEEELEEEHFGKTESQRPDELEYEYHFIPKQDGEEKKE